MNIEDLDNLDDENFSKQFRIAVSNNSEKEEEIIEEAPASNEDTVIVEEPKEKESNTDSNNEEESKSEDENTPTELDDKAKLLQELLAPIKANGKEIKIQNIEELRTLASKGIDYTQKTQKLSKESRIAQSLANHGLTDEAKLNLLIDVAKGDKEAIKKHLKNLEINPFDLDIDNTDYKPVNNLVSEAEITINNIVESIASQDQGVEFLQSVIPNSFTEQEINKIIINQPHSLKVLKEDYDKGIFKPIMDEINRLRTVKPDEFEGISIEEFYGYVKHQLFGSKQDINTKDEVTTSNPKKVIDVKVKELKENVVQDSKINKLNSSRSSSNSVKDNLDSMLDLPDSEFIKAMEQLRKRI